MKTLALFDFDHTLYKKDSLLEITKHIVGKRKFVYGMLYLMPHLIAMKAGLTKNSDVKERYLTYFFKGIDHSVFKKAAAQFSLSCIDKDIDPVLKVTLQNHIAKDHDVYIVTASFAEWLQPWCDSLGIQLIASKLEVKANKITGTINGQNCYGAEKVKRIKKRINVNDYTSICVYGKGKGDREMVTLTKS